MTCTLQRAVLSSPAWWLHLQCVLGKGLPVCFMVRVCEEYSDKALRPPACGVFVLGSTGYFLNMNQNMSLEGKFSLGSP